MAHSECREVSLAGVSSEHFKKSPPPPSLSSQARCGLALIRRDTSLGQCTTGPHSLSSRLKALGRQELLAPGNGLGLRIPGWFRVRDYRGHAQWFRVKDEWAMPSNFMPVWASFGHSRTTALQLTISICSLVSVHGSCIPEMVVTHKLKRRTCVNNIIVWHLTN